MMNELYHFSKKAEEYLYMIALNTKYKILGVFEVSHGTVNSSLVSLREIFIRALLCGATSIILLHNHPSQDCTPSKEDDNVTDRIKQVSKLIGIHMIDHIIIGNGYYSFIEKGIL